MINIYEIRCRHLDKQHDNNKNTGSVGSIHKICYIKKAIKKANDSLFIFKCLREKKPPSWRSQTCQSSLTFWFTAWISQALLPAAMWAIKMVFKTEVHCAGSKESWRVDQKSGRSHWAWPDAGVTERERESKGEREREGGCSVWSSTNIISPSSWKQSLDKSLHWKKRSVSSASSEFTCWSENWRQVSLRPIPHKCPTQNVSS